MQNATRNTPINCPACGGPTELDGIVSECRECGYVFVSAASVRREPADPHEAAGIPERFRDQEPGTRDMERILQTGRGLYIQGPNGTGKTRRACACAMAYLAAGMTARVTSPVRLMSQLRDSIGGSGTEAAVFRELSSPDLLVIDDLGKENVTGWAASMLYMAVDDRYGSMRPVVVTSNYSKQELVARLAADGDDSAARAIVSRLFEMTDKVEMGGPDRRLR